MEPEQDMIQQANAAAALLKEQNDRKEALIKREEALEARRVLAGQTTGNVQPIQKEEIDPVEYSKRVLRNQI